MKNKNLLIIGAVVIAAFFLFKKKKTAAILPTSPILPPPPIDNKFPIDMLPQRPTYPGGLIEGMRVVADNGQEQQILIDGKIYGFTYDQWAQRGFDAATVVSSDILNQIPYGGVYNSGLL
jgi:hypothetical protein